MNTKLLSLLLIFALAFSFSACGDDDDHHHHGDNEINIIIISPQEDMIISTEEASIVLISVRVEATEENHDIDIELHPEGDHSNKIIDWHRHTHDQVVEFTEVVDLSGFESGTEFHLEVTACIDHGCEEKERKHIHFTLE
ncbi:MAG: hypothetical protein EA409_10955 [Saprospirales bacterium]|nr:MAG: hypothetical protein EA409_10955 [Saprospirales bacterium]